jgi:hypothetical protein
MGCECMIDSIWDIISLMIMSGLSIVGAVALAKEYREKNNKKN